MFLKLLVFMEGLGGSVLVIFSYGRPFMFE